MRKFSFMSPKHLIRSYFLFQNDKTISRSYSFLNSLYRSARIDAFLRSKKDPLHTRCSMTSFSTSINDCSYKSQDKKKIPKQNFFANKRKNECLFGVAPCYLALKSGRRKIFKIFIRDGAINTTRNDFEEIRKMAEDKGIPIFPATRKQLLKLSQDRPSQNIVMEVSPLKFSHFEKSNSVKEEPELWIALDEVQDPMNFGAILRTSFLLGVSRVIVPLRNSAPLSPVVSKASAGAMEVMNIFQVSHMPSFLQERHNMGWDILGAVHPAAIEEKSNENPVDCTNYKMNKPTILILGNEGTGLQSQVLQQCTRLISIFLPSSSSQQFASVGPDSLNVSVATGCLPSLCTSGPQYSRRSESKQPLEPRVMTKRNSRLLDNEKRLNKTR